MTNGYRRKLAPPAQGQIANPPRNGQCPRAGPLVNWDEPTPNSPPVPGAYSGTTTPTRPANSTQARAGGR